MNVGRFIELLDYLANTVFMCNLTYQFFHFRNIVLVFYSSVL